MEKRAINLYTSNPADARVQSLAALLEQEQQRPVQLRDLRDMPAPDRQRPTRQQMLTRRADTQHELSACQELIRLGEPYPRLADEVHKLRLQEAHYIGIIEGIDLVLSEQEGGQADG